MPPRAATAATRGLGTLSLTERIGAYAELSKFGIVLLVLVSAGAGFMLSAPLGPEFPWPQGLLVLAGVMLLSCGASALNQVQERGRDSLMARTAGRPLPSGRLSHVQGLAFSIVAIAAGAAVLWLGVGPTAGILGLIASGFYNGVYTPWLKPNSPFAAVPGAIPGAIPPVIGWVTGGGHLTDAGAVILFGILFLWQMPHFWALALRYRADYAAGGFPMVSERVGVEGTARLIQLYALGLTAGRPSDLAGRQVRATAGRPARVALPLPLLELLSSPAVSRHGGGTADPSRPVLAAGRASVARLGGCLLL
jgi:heme o synthase